ncbi:MAG: sigma 54-interacting transcriptional regulator [Candidatus Hydrogenedentes bacterium]|nr:sigma 54-interacting transcriptional regulator [Candidatus Hydrogenedentota bacterium]
MAEQPPLHGLDEHEALKMILEGTATVTGDRFFAALVENLAKALNTYGAWVTEYLEETRTLRALAFWMNGEWLDGYEHKIDGTPCEAVVQESRLVHYADNVLELYGDDPDVQKIGAVSYMGAPLLDMDGTVLGHLAVMDIRPMPEEPKTQALFRIFAARAAAELRRLRAEAALREREEKLGRLLDSALDAIIDIDTSCVVTMLNPAAEKLLGVSPEALVGESLVPFLTEEGYEKLCGLVQELDARPDGQRFLWVPGGLDARNAKGEVFPAEATLSRYEMRGQTFHTLILRNVNERLQAEKRIQALTVQAEYLRQELDALQNFDEILGNSEAVRRVVHDIEQVAETDATVLISGETGTGKELVARAIHRRSRRRDKPLVKVNCAAIPVTLIESEFFGHEKGAFTGATQKREGRFALAHGGTIFLDEVGELPVDLQAKLLSVLQEGEFESVGSAHTRKVDVRIIAATNRDLQAAVKSGNFREDLYYRLHVFPIEVPPLRERGDDVVLLASAFATKYAKRIGRAIETPGREELRRLQSYSWPGNIRELENVIERAVITAQNGRMNLARALPDAGVSAAVAMPLVVSDNGAIKTIAELEELERENLIRALAACDWKVSGDGGAARLLGMNPSTLSSRMKTLGVQRPRA